MESINFKITGDKNLINKLNKMAGKNPKSVAKAIYGEATEIMSDSKNNYCPVDSSDLKNSGHVELPEIKGNNIIVKLGYGGAAAPYALVVHENPRSGKTGGVSPQGKKYKRWAKVGQWKYLETPLVNAIKGMAERLAGSIKKDLGV